MIKIVRRFCIALNYCIFLIPFPIAAQLDPHSPWPMFRGDLAHTGQSQYAGAQAGIFSWSYRAAGPWVYSSPAIDSDGTIYVGADDNRLYSFGSTGIFFWSYATGDYVRSSPTVGNDGVIYVGSYDYNLYAFASNGALSWSYATRDYVRSSPSIGSHGAVCEGSLDYTFYNLDSSGALYWS